ncbi:hypothetical protein [Bradyrhizobium sp. AUGA SZCCT0283]|uniref:hypothetical protein n=1 Tax=Bradyrhizobium sp. AUGA SZCCT0283 TaxID=2807671 RepID=UPI001BA46DB1|nr:hypothetical protein [Bradyrhizobium sp. AUGA SZCCT0283]MBR1278767.1 hypothetical protein [Bradyrhizobium sp. AUGA SZCCT0283]
MQRFTTTTPFRRNTWVTRRTSGARDTLVPALHPATIRVEAEPPYPLRRRIPSRSRPQKAMRIRAHVLTPSNSTIASSMTESLRWCHKKHARRSRNCHHSVAANVRTKPFSGADENILKQRAAYLVVNKTGTADMQFIFDLIWNQSRSRFLATIHEREAGQ